jgi:RNA polymerase sigma factor (sigma-70 family)
MLNRQQKAVLPHLCRLIGPPTRDDPPDRDLLERFLGRRDEAAFAGLVRRHGPMVLRVCRGVLRDFHDAEDAFQATFLVLARRARWVARPEALGGWLYGVAYRVALKARAAAARRDRHERQAARTAEEPPAGGEGRAELRAVLDEEVNRLPDKYRRPVVLCYFEGRTYQEVARLLGWPAGTASARLARAREVLRGRLARRGMALSPVALAACLAGESAPAACLLAGRVARAAVLWLADPAAAGVSTRVLALTEGVVKAMLMRKLKGLTGVVLAVGLAVGGAGFLARPGALGPAAGSDGRGEPRAEIAGRSGVDAPAADDQRGRAAAGPSAAPAADPPARAGAPPRALAPPAGEGARPPQTRIGLINMTRVLKGCKKVQASQADLRAQAHESQQKLAALQKQVQEFQARCDDPATPAADREQLAQKVRQLRRQIQDEGQQAQARLSKASGDTVAAAYREVEGAANRVAKQKGLELVLFYTDAVTEEDFYDPGALQRKLSQPGALVPLVAAPGMDITDIVIESLNGAEARPDGPGR